MPTILDILDRLTGGINEAFEIKVFKDKFTPGAITPPKYLSLTTTSNVVAVPKSKII